MPITTMCLLLHNDLTEVSLVELAEGKWCIFSDTMSDRTVILWEIIHYNYMH